MNIQMVRDNIKRTIAGKETLLAEWRSFDFTNTADRIHRSTVTGFLEINIKELRRLLADVERCVNKENDESWVSNPDRQGGSFTAEELDPNRGWK